MPNNMILLETIALTQSAASVTFDNLPTSGYTDLKIVMSGRDSSTTGVSGGGYSFTIYPNGLSTNISQRSIYGAGSGTPGSYTDTQMYNPIAMNADTANTYSNVEIYVPNYRSSNAKSFSIDGVTENNGTSAAARLAAGLWNSTAAITSLQFNAYSTWMAGSTFSLYGIAALGTTPVLAPKATGGNIVANDGTYWYHAFTSSGNFVPQTGLTADVLQIGGGGGGGHYVGGGGGAGGYQVFTSQSLASATNYACTIGSGGAGGTSTSSGSNGTSSQLGALTASIGGGGGGTYGSVGSNGASGGGGTAATGFQTAGTGTQGFNGGAGGSVANNYPAGGGGGSGAVGQTGISDTTGGAGGAGKNSESAWASATNTGVSGFYAGGGGGGTYAQTGGYSSGLGGSGGGGNAGAYGANNVGIAGVANTGSGGGGASGSSANPKVDGGRGGSGIVIIRYPIA
jgi:hypothetical protein